eukprot:6190380-Alexandrium_andersonii.AAC.1
MMKGNKRIGIQANPAPGAAHCAGRECVTQGLNCSGTRVDWTDRACGTRGCSGRLDCSGRACVTQGAVLVDWTDRACVARGAVLVDWTALAERV